MHATPAALDEVHIPARGASARGQVGQRVFCLRVLSLVEQCARMPVSFSTDVHDDSVRCMRVFVCGLWVCMRARVCICMCVYPMPEALAVVWADVLACGASPRDLVGQHVFPYAHTVPCRRPGSHRGLIIN